MSDENLENALERIGDVIETKIAESSNSGDTQRMICLHSFLLRMREDVDRMKRNYLDGGKYEAN